MNPPKWATALHYKALVWWESQGHQVPIPELRWRRCPSQRLSSGHGCSEYIHINAGRDRGDAKLLLLHELAHALISRQGARWHSAKYWDCAWALYRWAGLPLRQCLARERDYRKGAAVAYRRNRKAQD